MNKLLVVFKDGSYTLETNESHAQEESQNDDWLATYDLEEILDLGERL